MSQRLCVSDGLQNRHRCVKTDVAELISVSENRYPFRQIDDTAGAKQHNFGIKYEYIYSYR